MMERLQTPSGLLKEGDVDEYFMRLALMEAESAFLEGEVPVGAVLVIDKRIISKTHNMKEEMTDPTAHAEILAIRDGAYMTGNWRLNNSTLYVTKEPCIMCAGAMINARIGRLVYGCRDERYGAVESQFRLINDPRLNHRIEVISGILGSECGELLKRFFINLRND